MSTPSTFLVFGGTGGTGKHFITHALSKGHTVRALARTPSKFAIQDKNLHITQGSITTIASQNLDTLVRGSDYVVCMLGDKEAQRTAQINTVFVRDLLVPSMRRNGVKRMLYQAGGLSQNPGEPLSWLLWTIRKTVARGFDGQHVDNEGVMAYLAHEAQDLEWIVHRAGIYGDGESKGKLVRTVSGSKFSVATFGDCAVYGYETVLDHAAVRTSCFSHYA